MSVYFKYLFQLILSPSRGWEDISHDGVDPDELVRRGYYPLTGIMALTEFLRLLYDPGATVAGVLQRAIALFCAYFAALFLCRLMLDALLPKVTDGAPSERRTATLDVMCLGQMALIAIIGNCIPTGLTLIHFLPVYALLIFYKASRYMAVRRDSEMNYLVIGLLCVVVVPLGLYWLLSLILV